MFRRYKFIHYKTFKPTPTFKKVWEYEGHREHGEWGRDDNYIYLDLDGYFKSMRAMIKVKNVPKI